MSFLFVFQIRIGKGWKDVNGVRHPSNWHIWSDAHKASMNIKEIILDVKPDGKFHNWIDNGLQGISNITDKKLRLHHDFTSILSRRLAVLCTY